MEGRLRLGLRVILLCLGCGAVGAAVALSVPSQTGPKVYACVNSDTGAPASISEGTAPNCDNGNKLISWSQESAQPLSPTAQSHLRTRLSTITKMIGNANNGISALDLRIANLDDGLDLSGDDQILSLRLQRAMDRESKLMQTLSNILKKLQDTDSGIVQNLK
jgi:hypothetical protein